MHHLTVDALDLVIESAGNDIRRLLDEVRANPGITAARRDEVNILTATIAAAINYRALLVSRN